MAESSDQLRFPQSVAAVIVAAGRGERAGSGEGPKQYRKIGGRAVIELTLKAFASHPRIDRIVVAIHPDDETLFRSAAGEYGSAVAFVHGGATRQQSTLFALRALREQPPQAVLIHDAVRPFADHALIDRTIAAISEQQGALPSLPISETLKRSRDDGLVRETVPRAGIYAAQTPQGFAFSQILAAHEEVATLGKTEFTDDASIAEYANIPVRLVTGSPDNVKLTWARDIAMADEKLSGAYPDIRAGNGYDVHAFAPGNHVTLCGIVIPHDKTLAGHSDADVALHALTDALLATCGSGDIGTHFPPSDPQWRGAASAIFLEHAAKTVRSKGGRIANADITLICEAPKIGPHRDAMRGSVAKMLGISIDRVSVKATTNEKLGFIGREEGIAAIATASVAYPGVLPE